MDEIEFYISKINSQLLRQITGRPAELVKLIQNKRGQSEEEVINKICGDKKDRAYYANIKSRTLKILQALAIISTPRAGSVVKKKYDNCQKKFIVGQKFLTNGARVEGLRLIKQAYRIAVEFDFSHLACELASILYHDHVYYHKNKRLASLYSKKVRKYLNDYTAEKEAEHYFYQIVEQKHSIKEKSLLEAVKNISNKKGASVKYKVYEASIKVLYGIHSAKYEEVISSCTDALDFFVDKKGAYPAHYLFFLKNRAMAQTATAKYTDAAISYQTANQYTSNSPFNTYMIRFYSTLNALHAGQYQMAYDLYQQNKRCKIEDIRQQFVIIEAYICFLSYTGYLQPNKAFRMGKYLNETFQIQENKQGDNINILIAELLIYLARDRGKFIDRIETVQHYSYRHLKSKDTERAKWFLKILCMMPHPKVNFRPEALKRKAKRYIDLLKSHPVRMGEGFAVEIIPYEQVLNMIMVQLGRKAA